MITIAASLSCFYLSPPSVMMRRISAAAGFYLTCLHRVSKKKTLSCVFTIFTVYYYDSTLHCGAVYVPVIW